MKTSIPLAFILLILSFQVHAKWFSHQFETMGTLAKVEFELSDEKSGQKIVNQVVAEMERINQAMSPYIESSELSKLNRSAAKAPQKVSKELFDLVARSLEISELTHGAFDISFSSIGYLYDYRHSKKPSESQLAELKSAINYRNIHLDKEKQTIFFDDKRLKIDLGGIGKGHAVDRCIQLLQREGIHNGFVNAGGDTRIIGRKTDRPWYIGIRHPRDESKLIANLPLEDVALSTSGDYERFFEADGIRYHHIIDPKTGDSARAIQSATILADDSTFADALSTSIFILGVKDGMALVNQLENVSAIMVDNKGKMFLSSDLTQAN
ncbi:FAD:protein FMN transferase [Aliikangiella sp. G2MR2-5]|uniref:FAD:protein FMN transferase n=1 Tax=Aliikangiella sp. G2MR2-5 TaxID=2788943 RepID=UPI0018A8B12E|nr:FAD:protein FMN transferase [Aliikangiella sp. G2MR2-5]